MNLIYSAIEKLFPILTKNKKMSLAWAVFIVAVGWLIVFIPAYPAENAEFERFSLGMKQSESDYTNTMIVYDIVSPQILDAIQVRIYYLENFSNKYPYDTIKPEVVVQGYKQVTDVLSGIASARGTVNGASFYMTELNTYKEGFARDLTLMETYMKGYETFYLALIGGDAKKALNAAANFDSASANESITGFYVRLGNFSNQTKAGLDKQMADVNEKIKEVQLFNFKKFLSWLAFLYIVIFIPATIMYYRRTRNKSSRKSAYSKKSSNGKAQSKNKKAG